MKVLNRILAIVLFLALLALALLIAALPRETVAAVLRAAETVGAFLTGLENSYYWLYVAGRVLLAVAAVVIFVLLLWAEVRPRRPKAVHVRTEGGSKATVTTESVARRLAWHIDQLVDVISVAPQVSARGKAVDVVLDLETRPEIDVPMKTDEVVALAREVITDRMGLQIGRIQVHIKHAPYQDEV